MFKIMAWGFLSAFVQAGGREAVQGLTDAIVTSAPQTSIKAQQIRDNHDLDSAGEIIVRYRNQVNAAQNAFDTVDRQYHTQVSAAEVIDARLKAIDVELAKADLSDSDRAALTAEKASKTPSLNNLISKVEKMVPDLEHARSELELVQGDLKNAEQAYQEKAGALVTSKETLESSQREMERARLDADRAKQREHDAETLLGISNSGSNVNTAVNAMQRAAQKAKDEAAASNLKADTLKKHSMHDEDDPNIKAAIAEASGATSTGSLSDRLAALKK